jgi:hypothetical protein
MEDGILQYEEAEKLIVKIVDADPGLVLVDSNVRADFIQHVRNEISLFTGDLSTAGGRKAIASFAHKVTRTKTAIDNAGKALNEQARKQIAAVDAVRREMRETLDALRDEVRAPLTEWEVAEKERLEARDNTLRIINQAGIGVPGETAAAIEDRLRQLHCIGILEEVFQEGTESAIEALEKAKDQVSVLLDRAKSEEAAQAELEKLRAEAAAREKADREKAEAEAAAERIRLLKEQRAREEAERTRIAEEKAVAAAEAKHKAEIEAIQRAQLEKEIREKELRLRLKAEADKRKADTEHRQNVKEKAIAAFIEVGFDTEESILLFEVIEKGQIPNVQVVF